jgi:hypothetical protein
MARSSRQRSGSIHSVDNDARLPAAPREPGTHPNPLIMRRTLSLRLIPLLLLGLAAHAYAQRVVVVATADELQQILSRALDSVEIRLSPGSYHLVPTPQVEPTCGNCVDSATRVPYTRGVRISGRGVRLTGPADRSAEIVTHAGYGLLVEDCVDCAIENLTITGGERDSSVAATDAAIVVRRSSVAIVGNRIAGNIGDSATVARLVVGIMGICGREGSDMRVDGNEIMRNSWDGVALYRSARADIRGNVIDGVDAAVGAKIGGGRGVAIGLTWSAIATVEENLVRRYWKGIGVFSNASAYLRRNVVEDIVTWGIGLWAGDSGGARADIVENVVYATGACGASISRRMPSERPGRFERNVLVRTAQNPKYDSAEYYCAQSALALGSVPVGFAINDNLFFDNRRADPTLAHNDVSDEEFLPAIRQWCGPMSRMGALGRSDFLRRYCSDGQLDSERH